MVGGVGLAVEEAGLNEAGLDEAGCVRSEYIIIVVSRESAA
jgi:hypothetical protein